MVVSTHNYFPDDYYDLWWWEDMEEGSPSMTVRNRWLWVFGCFAKYNGLWFPCMVTGWDLQDNPLTVSVVVNSGNDVYTDVVTRLLPTNIPVEELEMFYNVLPLGIPITLWIKDYEKLMSLARTKIYGATDRSLETAIVTAPRRWASRLKTALNSIRKGEWFVVEGNQVDKDSVNVLPIPNTTGYLGDLWANYDWAKQDMYIRLGFTFNPEKRERMIQSEVHMMTQIVLTNRMTLEDNIKKQAEAQGEKAMHMATKFRLDEEKIIKTAPNAPAPRVAAGVIGNSDGGA